MQTHTRTRRSPVPALVTIGLLLFALGLLAWQRHQPIERGALTVCPEGSQQSSLQDGSSTRVCTVSNRDKRDVHFATTVRNTGRSAVTVRAVQFGDADGALFAVREVLMWPRNDAWQLEGEDELVPFEPFSLEHEEERLVWVNATLPPCERRASSRALTFRQLQVRTSFFGLPRDTRITLDPAVRVLAEAC